MKNLLKMMNLKHTDSELLLLLIYIFFKAIYHLIGQIKMNFCFELYSTYRSLSFILQYNLLGNAHITKFSRFGVRFQ